MSRGWNFEVVDADEKRVFRVKVERLLGFFEGEEGDDGGGDENLVRGFFGSRGRSTAGEEEMTMAVEKEIHASVQFAAGDGHASDGGSGSSSNGSGAATTTTGVGSDNGDASGASVVSAAVAAAVEEDMTHAEAMSRQAKMLNISESNRVERLVEQNEMKAAAVRAETLLREEEKSQEEEKVDKSSNSS